MTTASSSELQALRGALHGARRHVFEALSGLDSDALRLRVLPSGWTCLGLVNHLSRDVERFWFQAVIAGEQTAIDDVLSYPGNAWTPSTDEPCEEILATYRYNIERADDIVGASSLDAAPTWWPEKLFGSWRLETVREIVLHVIVETATHTGHLDAARELIDGELHLVLTD